MVSERAGGRKAQVVLGGEGGDRYSRLMGLVLDVEGVRVLQRNCMWLELRGEKEPLQRTVLSAWEISSSSSIKFNTMNSSKTVSLCSIC